MKKFIFILSIFAFSAWVLAKEKTINPKSSPYDVVAPTIPDGPPANPIQGQIYYDATLGSFMGINSNGNPDAFSLNGSNAVVSLGTERSERATIELVGGGSPDCTVLSDSGSWVTTARSSQGVCNLTMTGFSVTPTCVVSGHGDNSCVSVNVTTTTAAQVRVKECNSTGMLDTTFHIICMGAR